MAERSRLPEQANEAVFDAFYRETAPSLWAYIRRASGDAALADDLLQETFHKFLRANRPELQPPQMKAYLYRTAMTLLSDHWRRAKRERQWSLRTIFRTVTSKNAELTQDVSRGFERLKPQEQALLWLAYVEGFDHGEIAATLDLKVASVRVLLFRARKKLAGMLTGEGLGLAEGFGPKEDI